MRIGIVGGGPAGLYFALLMKRADPTHQITVAERNPADATFGWGVVFSEDTLTELRDADYETFLRLEEHLVRWGAIDVRYRGRVLRAHGHGFSAISRHVFLGVLQERCRELGVELFFGREVGDLTSWSDRDLIVGADGVNSWVRTHHEGAFRPGYDVHPTRYAWFGTDLVFDAFTFIFEPTDHGLFQVHAYPFSGDRSTFIVETTEETWRQAGLDRLGEKESLAFCEDLFATHLDGHRLFSNRSAWINFVTLANQNWHLGNIVLVGDAVHTAHFSIGSGTKLAVDGAVALAKGFQAHPGDMAAAFAEYELERQPRVERFQAAARDSARYFEGVGRYLHFDPEPFVFNLLTRSGRITRADLEQRDPVLVNLVDRWAQAAGTGVDRVPLLTTPPRTAPLAAAGAVFANRVARSLPAPDSAREGVVVDEHRRGLELAAASGASLVMTEPVAVAADGRITPGSAGLYGDEHTEAWAEVTAAVHDRGGLIGVRLSHAGPRGATRLRSRGTDRPLPEGGWGLLAASDTSFVEGGPVAKGMGPVELERVRTEFMQAATLADPAGFDLVEVDASAGYLLASFLSPLTNHRDDHYGGDLAGRLRYPVEVVEAVRSVWEGPLVVRVSASDWHPAGSGGDQLVVAARAWVEAGANLIEVAGGSAVGAARPEFLPLYLVPFADRVRNEAGTPVMVGGGITTLDQIDTIVAAGRADLCLLDPVLYDRSPYRDALGR